MNNWPQTFAAFSMHFVKHLEFNNSNIHKNLKNNNMDICTGYFRVITKKRIFRIT